MCFYWRYCLTVVESYTCDAPWQPVLMRSAALPSPRSTRGSSMQFTTKSMSGRAPATVLITWQNAETDCCSSPVLAIVQQKIKNSKFPDLLGRHGRK